MNRGVIPVNMISNETIYNYSSFIISLFQMVDLIFKT